MKHLQVCATSLNFREFNPSDNVKLLQWFIFMVFTLCTVALSATLKISQQLHFQSPFKRFSPFRNSFCFFPTVIEKLGVHFNWTKLKQIWINQLFEEVVWIIPHLCFHGGSKDGSDYLIALTIWKQGFKSSQRHKERFKSLPRLIMSVPRQSGSCASSLCKDVIKWQRRCLTQIASCWDFLLSNQSDLLLNICLKTVHRTTPHTFAY